MDGDKAVGIDGVTKEDYDKNLSENLDDLLNRMKRNAYKPKAARRVEIPKDNGKMRSLSIYCYEDKLVQEAIRRILEAIFEPLFYDEMMGFRPHRNCHQALQKLNKMLEWRPTNYVLDADIKGFFDHLDHEWIMKFIGSKINETGQENAESGNHRGLPIRTDRRRVGTRVGVFSCGSKYLYALRSSVVVSRAGHTKYERLLRNHSIR